MPSTTASATKTTNDHGISVPGTSPNPSTVNAGGKSLTPRGPRMIRARPRKRASVPSVTTSDGRPPSGRERAVEEPAGGTHHEDDRDRDLEGHARGPHEAEGGARQAGHRLDRQVDLAEDDDQGQGQGHDRHFHQGGERGSKVAGRQEERRQRVAEDDQSQEGDQEERLPAGQQPRPAARARADVVAPVIGHRSACSRAGRCAG